MRISSFFSVAVAAISTAAAATMDSVAITPTTLNWIGGCESAEIPCDGLMAAAQLDASPTSTLVEVVPRHLTNAQRLAQGLPLKRPHRRSAHRRLDHLPSPVSSPSPMTTHRGVIEVFERSSGKSMGYVSSRNIGGYVYGVHAELGQALNVSFKLPVGATRGERLQVTPENSSITGYEYLSLVQGRDNVNGDFDVGSFHYDYISASVSTPAGSNGEDGRDNAYKSKSRLGQSSVWFYNQSTGDFEPQWINSDGGIAPTTVFSQSGALYVGGDADTFYSHYPSPVTTLVFQFVSL